MQGKDAEGFDCMSNTYEVLGLYEGHGSEKSQQGAALSRNLKGTSETKI